LGILVLWLAGLGMLARRTLVHPYLERLSEAALRVDQSTSYFAILSDGDLIGYGSSIVDTTVSEITITDGMYTQVARERQGTVARTKITLSRSLRLKAFDSDVSANGVHIIDSAVVIGDTLRYWVASRGKARAVHDFVLDGPVLLPRLVQLAIALTDKPAIGKTYTFPVFDPTRQAVIEVSSRVNAESLFVVPDSAVLDSTTRRWRAAHTDTLRGWQVTSTPGGFNGWLDEGGNTLETTKSGSEVSRTTYQQSYDNSLLDYAESQLRIRREERRARSKPAPKRPAKDTTTESDGRQRQS
jgi:hypothetical protein